MKKQYFSFLIIWFLLAFCVRLAGQTNGDYQTRASGTWNSYTCWQKYNSTLLVWEDCLSGDFPPVTALSKRVTILNGHTITATSNITGATGGTIEVADGGTLTMGNWYIRGSGINPRFATIIINGHLTTNNYISTSTFTLGSNGHFMTSYSGTEGWWLGTSRPATVNLDGEMEFNGSGGQIIPEFTYVDLIASGGSSKTMSGYITISGMINIASGTQVNLPDCILIIYGNGAGILNDGVMAFNYSYLYFEEGSQTFSGSGTFSGTAELFSVGETLGSTLTYSVPNLLTVTDMIVYSGSSLTLGSETKVTVNNSLTTNNSLTLDASTSSPYRSASLIVAEGASITGNTNVKLYLTGGSVPDGYRWHLISSPFTSLNRSPFTAVTLDLAQWIEGTDRMSLDEGWVAFDGFIYPSGPSTGPTFTNMATGKGYTYYYSSNQSYTVSGMLNNSNQNITLTCFDPDIPELYGHNLVGNPFTSGLNWDAIIADAGYPASTSKTLHYRKDGTHVYYANGLGSEPGVNGIIPPMQGFFVKTFADGGVLNLAASARVHDNIPSRYKGSKSVIPFIRLKINTGELSDYAAIRFENDAKTGIDYDYDAVKEFLSAARPSIYSVSEGSKFVINGLPFPSPFTDIPIAIKIITAGNYTISVPEMSGLENYSVQLFDRNTGTITDLQTNPSVSFASTAELIPDRFVLRVAELATDIDNPKITPEKQFTIYHANDFINILTWSNEWNNQSGAITVYDLSGRVIKSMPDAFLSQTSIIQMEAPAVRGLYIIEIRSGMKRFAGKILIP